MTVNTDEKIYRAYRGVLRKQTANRAGARRNQARSIITERYDLSFQDLKRIVQEGDELHGVNHPHSPEYLQKLKFAKQAKELQSEHGDVCPICNSENKEFVRARLNPEVELFNTELEPLYSCFECYLGFKERIASSA